MNDHPFHETSGQDVQDQPEHPTKQARSIGIDLSEFIRVFGAAPDQAENAENKARIAALDVEVRVLREQRDACQKREEWRREQAEKTQRLLKYRPEQPIKKIWRFW